MNLHSKDVVWVTVRLIKKPTHAFQISTMCDVNLHMKQADRFLWDSELWVMWYNMRKKLSTHNADNKRYGQIFIMCMKSVINSRSK